MRASLIVAENRSTGFLTVKEDGAKQNAQRHANGDAKGQLPAGSEIEEWKLHGRLNLSLNGISVAGFCYGVKQRKSCLPPLRREAAETARRTGLS